MLSAQPLAILASLLQRLDILTKAETKQSMCSPEQIAADNMTCFRAQPDMLDGWMLAFCAPAAYFRDASIVDEMVRIADVIVHAAITPAGQRGVDTQGMS